VALHTMLDWGATERDRSGRRLIPENPIKGIAIPREKNPVRPLVMHDEFLALVSVADRVNPLLPLALVVVEGTGRRLSAVRLLRWPDVDLEAGTIHRRADHALDEGARRVLGTQAVPLLAVQRTGEERAEDARLHVPPVGARGLQ
jgi:integrase